MRPLYPYFSCHYTKGESKSSKSIHFLQLARAARIITVMGSLLQHDISQHVCVCVCLSIFSATFTLRLNILFFVLDSHLDSPLLKSCLYDPDVFANNLLSPLYYSAAALQLILQFLNPVRQ